MNKNLRIQKTGLVLILAGLLVSANSYLTAGAGIRPSEGAGIRPSKLPKLNRDTPYSRAKSKMSVPSFRLALPDFTPRALGNSDILKSEPTGYLPVRGPVDLRLSASSPREFDRSKIIYIEHEGNFPKGPTQYPPGDPLPLIPQPPKPNPPAPTQSATATAAPVVADTTEPSLMDRLQNPGPQKSVTGTSILFNNKIDGITPSGQEIMAPFIVPLNTNPPAIKLGTKATYIRE